METQIYTTEAFAHQSNVDRPLYIRFHSSTLFFSINTVVFFGRFRNRGFTQTLPTAQLVLALKLMVQEFLLEPSIKADGQFDIFFFLSFIFNGARLQSLIFMALFFFFKLRFQTSRVPLNIKCCSGIPDHAGHKYEETLV